MNTQLDLIVLPTMARPPISYIGPGLLVRVWCLVFATVVVAGVAPLASIVPIVHGCSDNDATHVADAWREAGDLAKAHYEWSPGGTWQAAMDLYMGNDTRTDYDFWGDPGDLVARKFGFSLTQ